MPDANEHENKNDGPDIWSDIDRKKKILEGLESASGTPRSMPLTDGPVVGAIVMPIEVIREHSEALHQEREEARALFNNAKENLIDQMVLYGIDEEQATIQVESLIEATRNAVLLED